MTAQMTTKQAGESATDWRQRKADAQNYLELQTRLMDESDMIGWLCTIHNHAVQYPKVPPATVQEIQNQLSTASNLISIIYIWALLEEGGFNENSKWVSADEQLELKAWKHVRHTSANMR
jgi:hypothetical protein